MAVLSTAAGPAAAEDGYALIVAAEEAYRAGDDMRAMELSDRALATDDLTQRQKAQAYAWRGQGLLYSARLEAAIADFDASEAAYGSNSFSYWGRSLASLLLGRDEEAWRNADEGLEFSATDSELLLFRGLAAWKLGRYEAAVEDLEDTWDWNDDRGLHAAALASALESLGRTGEAQALYAEAAAAPVPAARELVFLGALAARGGSRDTARALLCMAWRTDPANGDVTNAGGQLGIDTTGC